ncbi:MAG: hypothetical protein AB7O96_07930 [Pseudobdellovibrionaceae bacterium]
MVIYFIALVSVILFSLCARELIRSVMTREEWVMQSSYSFSARRIGKVYRVFSWGLMTGVFLSGLVMSFSEVFFQM